MRIWLDFDFEVVGDVSLGADNKLRFPPLPTTPGVYRFRLLGGHAEAIISTYIGETDNLHRRASQYRNPGPSQQTNIHMRDRLCTHLDGGGTVEFAITTRAWASFSGKERFLLDLSQKAHRRLLENAALVFNPKGELIENRP